MSRKSKVSAKPIDKWVVASGIAAIVSALGAVMSVGYAADSARTAASAEARAVAAERRAEVAEQRQAVERRMAKVRAAHNLGIGYAIVVQEPSYLSALEKGVPMPSSYAADVELVRGALALLEIHADMSKFLVYKDRGGLYNQDDRLYDLVLQAHDPEIAAVYTVAYTAKFVEIVANGYRQRIGTGLEPGAIEDPRFSAKPPASSHRKAEFERLVIKPVSELMKRVGPEIERLGISQSDLAKAFDPAAEAQRLYAELDKFYERAGSEAAN